LDAGAVIGTNAPAQPLLSSISSGRKTGPYGLQGHEGDTPMEAARSMYACSSYLVVRYAGTGRLGQGGLPCGTATCRWIMQLADPFRTAHPTPENARIRSNVLPWP